MGERGGDFNFAEESRGLDRSGQLRLEELQCDLSMMLEVLGEIDSGHAATAQFPHDQVPRELGPVLQCLM